ncbi:MULTISPECIES: collagen-like protein [unclassified Anabaena]|uniref:collagen-like protein n=1 Tax=unclassified Anabaena TaxID=2619674 RepID=UPI0014461D1C|nr:MULTISPECIES: collagen-like protein [unclassified Anabaena]MTJ10745.1 collagen-like protein [Anabaena sp. UHCC 0204]MTJ54023.1 collagen-like protein [Anabaena sp. UHCC 0253]
MHKSFRYQLPFLLTFCLFSNLLPATGEVVCPTNVKESKIARYYDRDGSRGSNGRSGRDGRSGENQTINADGATVNLDLSGTNGEDGEDGEQGDRPSCRNQREEGSNNINAPNGGNGGSGGNGGNGGNGGDLTVYYTNLADLKKISVRAVGGEGGRSGRGARGAAGCACRRRRWERETCTGTPGTPNRKCTKKVYRCDDGRDGSDGSNGRDGTRGRSGILSIINGNEPLVGDKPTAEIGISQLANQQLNLSKNKWQIRQGANSLLAIGSVIADEYREFERRLDGTLKLIWQEKKAISNFSNQSVKLSLNDNQQIDIAFPENIWIDGTAKTAEGLTEYTVNHAISKEDVTRLAVAEFANSGQNLSLRVVDLAAKSDVINTQFRVKYRAKDNFYDSFNSPTLYEGEIPAELVSRSYNSFNLALGKLKIPSQGLNPGTNVDIEIIAVRSLGGRSAQQKISWQGVIRQR